MHRISCTEALARLVALLWGCTYLLEYLQASLPAGLSFEYATVFELQNVYQLSHSSTASGTSKIDIQSGANSIGIEDGPTGPSHSAQFFVSDGYHAGQFYIQVRLYEPILSHTQVHRSTCQTDTPNGEIRLESASPEKHVIAVFGDV